MSPDSVGDNGCGIRKRSAAGLHFYLAICMPGLAARAVGHNASGCFHWKALCKQHSGRLLLFKILIWDNPSSDPLHIVVQWLRDGFVFRWITPVGGPSDPLLPAQGPTLFLPTPPLQGCLGCKKMVLFASTVWFVVRPLWLRELNDQMLTQKRGLFSS